MSLQWAAPEQFSENEDITAKTDIYSFGIILWEIVTGEHPYFKQEPYSIMMAILNGKCLEIPETCEDKLAGLIRMCWLPSQERRPSSMSILNCLKKILKVQDDYCS